jgi:hypothetical protein
MTPCTEWTSYRNAAGYGVIGRRKKRAHRRAWEEKYGPIPEGLDVRHKCDNPACINVEHLELGTHAENMQDMVQRGRSSRGSQRPLSKLTEDQVKVIRIRLADPYRGINNDLAAEFGVSKQTICNIKNGRGWDHVLAGSGPSPSDRAEAEGVVL